MSLFTLLLFSCSACTSCIELPIDNNNENETDDNQDTSKDSGDTARDTAPPPPCPVMEEEDNGDYDNAMPVPMETWVCGTFDQQSDLDVYLFSMPQDGWLKLWVRGQDLGSNSDLLVSVTVGDETALSTVSYGSTDPQMIVPISEASDIFGVVQEQYNGFGENHFYEALFSEVKPPLEYNAVEDESIEDNNGYARGTVIEDGDRLLARIDSNLDRDWFQLTVPPGLSSLTIEIEAFMFGSPLDPILYLYPPDPEDEDDYLRVRNNADPNNLDPILTYTLDGGEEGLTYNLLVKSFAGTGSEFYWYVMDVSVDSTN